MTKVRSRLIIDHVLPSERQFTCVGQSAGNTVHSTTTIHGAAGGRRHTNITDLLALDGPKKARITLFYSVIFETIGNSILLPCQASGRPRPKMMWTRDEEDVLAAGDPRVRVLDTGELFISELKWVDMGLYVCVAENAISKDSISTFVYPLLVSCCAHPLPKKHSKLTNHNLFLQNEE